MALCPQTAVISHYFPAHPFAGKEPSEWMGHSQRVSQSAARKCRENKTAMSCGFMALCPQTAVILALSFRKLPAFSRQPSAFSHLPFGFRIGGRARKTRK
jgi:hypothetical protein